MGDWVEGDHKHILLLQKFECAPTLWRRIKHKLKRGLPVAEIWSVRVQSHVRNLHPRLKPPAYMYVNQVSGEGHLRAVAAYRVAGKSGHELDILFYLLATHLKNRTAGLGQAGLELVIDEARLLALRARCTSVTISGEVHVENEPCQTLLRKNGWQPTGEWTPDGLHELWAIRGVVEQGVAP